MGDSEAWRQYDLSFSIIIARQRRKFCTAFRAQLWTMRGGRLSVRHLISVTLSKMFLFFFLLKFFRIHPSCFATVVPGSTTDWAQQRLQKLWIQRCVSVPHISSPSLEHRHRHLPLMSIHTGMVITELTSTKFSRALCITSRRKETLDVSFILESNASKSRNYSWIRDHISHENKHLSSWSKSTELVQGLCIQSSAAVITRIYPG